MNDNTITASNGWELRGNGAIYSSSEANHPLIGKNATQALEGLFQEKRDQELGRWRWPENPDYVVSLSEGGESVWVLNERENGMISFTREMSTPVGEEEAGYSGAAWAYFAAHPEPKPWHDAKPGEVWVFELDNGTECAATREYGPDFKLSYGNLMSPRDERIAAGRRIWPEES